MTKLFLGIFLSSFLFFHTGKLSITVKNIQIGKGSVVVEIYNNESDFFVKHFTSKTEKANAESMDFLFDLPEGNYAVAVYQDLNDNKLLDRGWGFLHIPKEPTGLSNNFRPRFSAPRFNDLKFYVFEHTSITIELE